MSVTTTPPAMSPAIFPSRIGEPAWDIARLFPSQGEWTETEYLALQTNQLVELSDGCVEVLPMPTIFHQLITQFLFKLLDSFVTGRIPGLVLLAPLPVRLWSGKMREPDVLYLGPGRVSNTRGPAEGADLVMEVVSEGQANRDRDLLSKRQEYARARIVEYWIVDPQEKTITVLTLDGDQYRIHGVFAHGSQATSVLLPGFTVDVAGAFAAGEKTA